MAITREKGWEPQINAARRAASLSVAAQRDRDAAGYRYSARAKRSGRGTRACETLELRLMAIAKERAEARSTGNVGEVNAAKLRAPCRQGDEQIDWMDLDSPPGLAPKKWTGGWPGQAHRCQAPESR
jgi:hypothetical protein